MKSPEEVDCLEPMNREDTRQGKGMRGGQCIATNFLLSWSVAGAIAGLETKAIFPDLGLKRSAGYIVWERVAG